MDKKKEMLNKEGLISQVAEKTGLTKTQAKSAVEEVFSILSDHLAKGEKFQYIGFGMFGVKERPARTGINPATREKISIEAKKVPYFSPGKKLSEKVQNS